MKIGILGGTFDPIHNGHLSLARGALKHLRLDSIVFVPARVSPHKTVVPRASEADRYHMIFCALKMESAFKISRVELERVGPSYTFETLRELRRHYHRETEWVFLAGTDCLNDLYSWHRFQDLLKCCRFTVVTRPGFSAMRIPPGVHLLKCPNPDISSRLVRERVAAGKSISGLVPEAVQTVIRTRGLYRKRARKPALKKRRPG